ncbi:nuclear transport factor 2 family protein [Micromonospora sp. FIMYZ51]|uniref:nuclear transport factor 2 family protein n=1 Tax=Micromonospora sp. FIMYZ51 TaxID=3051832 RepID=UPI00311E163A
MADTLISRMFHQIDQADWTELATCFHPEVIYERPGYEPLVGLDRLMRFYRDERAIVESHHTLDEVLRVAESGAAWGQVVGRLVTGVAFDLQFAEIYRFTDGLVAVRRSYFFTPAV